MQGGEYALDRGAHCLRRRSRPEARRRQRSATAVRIRRPEQLGAERVGAARRQDRRESRPAHGARHRRPSSRPCSGTRSCTPPRVMARSRCSAVCCCKALCSRRKWPRNAATTAASPSAREPRRAAADDAQQPRSGARDRIFTACATWPRPATTRTPPSRCNRPSCACPRRAAADGGRLATLFASHPPSAERVEKNRATAATLAKGGDLGRERYQAATAQLREREPAYEAYDEGRAALADDRPSRRRALRAASAAATARGSEHPCPARRHRLASSAATRMRCDHYEDAIARDDEFFYYHLQQGLAHRQLRQWEESRAELETSVRLAADGRRRLRARHAGRAARRSPSGARVLHAGARARDSPAGQAAADATVRLDLPNNPGKYVQARGGLDNAGQLVVEVANPTARGDDRRASWPCATPIRKARSASSGGASMSCLRGKPRASRRGSGRSRRRSSSRSVSRKRASRATTS